MQQASGVVESVLREGRPGDVAECVALWVEACAARDGTAVAGVAERARPKFDRAECFLVAEAPTGDIRGFVLATEPGSGLPSDPAGAAVIGLLAVAPSAQGQRLGARLMDAAADELRRRGHESAVLHALLDNRAAVRLYTGRGWRAFGEVFEHSLLKRPMQTFVLETRKP
ncbi:GNAT family N-acetyltransferase [Subtercola boreus]|uniref:N-acetyltransferase domain-containing protein n=1 Tax=Subtercola boreus TaxID=120213 RepID=A0A3E0W883_9MICO|nr:GNAT family N-acetyltransferase [Subtercola boreus]RFA19031.1 hypothetical protein B7R24_12920 [Subtercola boreus]RFA19169.1 hypothetical protein B7R23_12900 [Subtercola boreus]RFA25631.1 hypothetical protein B7R25_13020 [Subtercola boreus]